MRTRIVERHACIAERASERCDGAHRRGAEERHGGRLDLEGAWVRTGELAEEEDREAAGAVRDHPVPEVGWGCAQSNKQSPRSSRARMD